MIAVTAVARPALGRPVGLVASNGVRHTRLLKSAPPNDATLPSPPTSVTLWFTKPVQPKLSRLQLTDATGAAVATSPIRVVSDSSTALVAGIRGPLKPGAYVVTWSTTSRDSHVIKGTLRFRVTSALRQD